MTASMCSANAGGRVVPRATRLLRVGQRRAEFCCQAWRSRPVYPPTNFQKNLRVNPERLPAGRSERVSNRLPLPKVRAITRIEFPALGARACARGSSQIRRQKVNTVTGRRTRRPRARAVVNRGRAEDLLSPSSVMRSATGRPIYHGRPALGSGHCCRSRMPSGAKEPRFHPFLAPKTRLWGQPYPLSTRLGRCREGFRVRKRPPFWPS
jgi:hypothetical protein